jgi:hypothetical protein
MSVLPSEREAILIVDSDAVAIRLITLQKLEAIAGGGQQIFEPRSDVQQFQFPLGSSPKFARNSPGSTSVSLPKQIRRSFVAK